MILLIGSEGSMGKRYQAIFNHLGYEYIKCDKEASLEKITELLNQCDRVLIATPTDTHITLLKHIISLDKDILCEKPICKSSKEVEEVLELVNGSNSILSMVFQYGEITHYNDVGPSEYDYFRTGNDGLVWDCFQIISLANGEVSINNESPVWKCRINGRNLTSSDMDKAYISFIVLWYCKILHQNHEWLINAHKKVEQYALSR